MSAMPMADVRATHTAMTALGWTHEQIERLIGKRCSRCLSPRRRDNAVCVRCRVGADRAAVQVVTVTCPGCKRERKRRGAGMRITACSADCRDYVRKCRLAGVTP